MNVQELEMIWSTACLNLLGQDLAPKKNYILAKQTFDSIRRIKIYETYKVKADNAVKNKISFFDTYTPFVLGQRTDLSLENRVWLIYLATYFGKSNKSQWTLFNRAAFHSNCEIIDFEWIKNEMYEYFDYLLSFDFFENCTFSNHRKYSAKSLEGEKGVFKSFKYFIDNIDSYTPRKMTNFHDFYKISQAIPNFGRLAGFDFTSSLVKCGFNIYEPESMYAEDSTGPLQALSDLLKLTGNDSSLVSAKNLAKEMMNWFDANTNIFMLGQVLEDSICNWQKNKEVYIKYTG